MFLLPRLFRGFFPVGYPLGLETFLVGCLTELSFCLWGFAPSADDGDAEITVELLDRVVENMVFWEEDRCFSLGDLCEAIVCGGIRICHGGRLIRGESGRVYVFYVDGEGDRRSLSAPEEEHRLQLVVFTI